MSCWCRYMSPDGLSGSLGCNSSSSSSSSSNNNNNSGNGSDGLKPTHETHFICGSKCHEHEPFKTAVPFSGQNYLEVEQFAPKTGLRYKKGIGLIFTSPQGNYKKKKPNQTAETRKYKHESDKTV